MIAWAIERDDHGAPLRMLWLGKPHGPKISRARREECRAFYAGEQRRATARPAFARAGKPVPRWLK